MPSSFSQNLGIELPADGELDGLWGDVVNTNMNILDRAINGTVTLTLTGTTSTLTTSDGVLSNGQYRTLLLGGSPSGTHTITISPNDAQKMYLVKNNTAQSVVFTQGSGGNVTIAAGDSAIIYSNGGGSVAAVGNIADDLAMSSPKITGGSINGVPIVGGSVDNTPIGATTRSTGAFTTLAANGSATFTGGTTLSGNTQVNGPLGLNGANYGTAGEALISGGPGNPPQWGSSFPAGGIIMWSGSIASIPAGWALCNGLNGTPDLRNRFIVGAGSTYAPGDTGGADTVTLTAFQMPVHAHDFGGTTSSNGAHSHNLNIAYFPNYTPDAFTSGLSTYTINMTPITLTTTSAGAHTHTFSGTTGNTGSGGAHENRPPYYALAYIMKL